NEMAQKGSPYERFLLHQLQDFIVLECIDGQVHHSLVFYDPVGVHTPTLQIDSLKGDPALSTSHSLVLVSLTSSQRFSRSNSRASTSCIRLSRDITPHIWKLSRSYRGKKGSRIHWDSSNLQSH